MTGMLFLSPLNLLRVRGTREYQDKVEHFLRSSLFVHSTASLLLMGGILRHDVNTYYSSTLPHSLYLLEGNVAHGKKLAHLRLEKDIK